MDIYVMSETETERVLEMLQGAEGRCVRVAIEPGHGLMVKVGGGVWTPPLGVRESELDLESSASRQHYIDVGRYLTREEVAEITAPVEIVSTGSLGQAD